MRLPKRRTRWRQGGNQPVPLRAQYPPGDVGRANTNKQNPTDPHDGATSGCSVLVLARDHFGGVPIGGFSVINRSLRPITAATPRRTQRSCCA